MKPDIEALRKKYMDNPPFVLIAVFKKTIYIISMRIATTSAAIPFLDCFFSVNLYLLRFLLLCNLYSPICSRTAYSTRLLLL